MNINKPTINMNQYLDAPPQTLLQTHEVQVMQSPYTNNIWLSLLPADLNEKLKLIHCESDEDMLMRNYLYTANNWLPFIVGPNTETCTQDLVIKLNSMLKTEEDVQQWKNAVREVFEHMEQCYSTNSLTKLNKLSKDWRVTVFSRTKLAA